MHVLKLKKVKSYRGEVVATEKNPELQIPDAEQAQRLVATGYFEQVAVYDSQAPSLFTRDPGNIGGVNCRVRMFHNTAEVSGGITWDGEDLEIGREEGNRVGFLITAPEGQDVTGATFTYKGKNGLVAEDLPHQDPQRLYWYPLVQKDTTVDSITVNWNPEGGREDEVFTVTFSDFQLEPKPQTEKEKLLVLLDGMRNIDQLKQYAEDEKIDLGGVTKRADIIAAIVAAKFPDDPEPFIQSAPAVQPESTEDPETDPTENE